MFVSSAKHKNHVAASNLTINYLVREVATQTKKYKDLLAEWNALVDRVNKAGGDKIFKTSASNNTQFTADELRTLVQLCHPDKHGGKEAATRMTQKLNQIRESMNGWARRKRKHW